MKVACLFIAVVALSSCVAKNYMVGSVNDQYHAPRLKKSHLLDSSVEVQSDSISSSYSTGPSGSTKNPVGKTGIFPNR